MLNNLVRNESKMEVPFFITYAEQRRLHWRLARYWSLVRLHRKLILWTISIGGALGLLVSSTMPPLYSSIARIDTGVCRHGVKSSAPSSNYRFCVRCEEEALPAVIKLGRRMDDLSVSFGMKNAPFGRAASNLVTQTPQ
jgi:hypothetical protein